MCRLSDIKAVHYSGIFSLISEKKVTSKEFFILVDDILVNFLLLLNIQYSIETNPDNLLALRYMANIFEKIQYLVWCIALKCSRIQFSMRKNFLLDTSTTLFLTYRNVNDFTLVSNLPAEIIENMAQWTSIYISLARALFPTLSHISFKQKFFGNEDFRKFIFEYYFS